MVYRTIVAIIDLPKLKDTCRNDTTMTTLDNLIEQLEVISVSLGKIQSKLDFDEWRDSPQFATPKGLGRVALLACLLGILWGIHGVMIILLSLDSWVTDGISETRFSMVWQWCFYVWTMCTFHLLEFFTTAIYNPTATSGNSFLVNHSKAYTAAALIAATEFWIKVVFFPSTNMLLCRLGIGLVLVSQIIRSLAMITCGESFNHLIQTSKKENHVLMTHGIYRYFRHPSYVGFYYWSIGTQLVLGNWLSAIVFAVASLMFFRRRIPYEEESLLQHFPEEYPVYARQTWVGIPFVPSCIEHEKSS
jgi:protein-S-isoprenylcysteine O-methyltransferase